MGKDETSDFVCYNCNTKNYFDKNSYIKDEKRTKPAGENILEVSIECKSCREVNIIKIKF